MRGLGDSTQHELKVLGEQVVQPKHADFDAYERSSARLGPGQLMRTRLRVYAAKRLRAMRCFVV